MGGGAGLLAELASVNDVRDGLVMIVDDGELVGEVAVGAEQMASGGRKRQERC